jgi:hypothetical protein
MEFSRPEVQHTIWKFFKLKIGVFMSSNLNGLDRREFVMKGLTVSAVGSFVALAAGRIYAQPATPAAAPAVTPPAAPAAVPTTEIDAGKLLPDNNPLVIALKYTPDAAKAELRKAPRQGVEAKDQFCSNCQLYKAAGILKGTKEELGVCQMIPGGNVKAAGWCNSWVKKA